MVKPTKQPSKDTIPVIVAAPLDDVPTLDPKEKKKDKEFNAFVTSDVKKVTPRKPMAPKTKKKKLKTIEKAIALKDQTSDRIEKRVKKALVKKRWNALY